MTAEPESKTDSPAPKSLTLDKSSKTVSRTIWYKRPLFPTIDGATFSVEQAIRDALKKSPDWRDRRQQLAPNEVMALNENDLLSKGVTGRVMLFELDSALETGLLSQGGATIATQYLEAENGREICTGTCNFYVLGNHVVLITSRAVRWAMFANFLNHWFQTQTITPKGWRFELKDVLPAPVEKELLKVKRVEIEARLDWQDLNDPPQDGMFRRLLSSTTEKLGNIGIIDSGNVTLKDAVASRSYRTRLVVERVGSLADGDEGFLEHVANSVRAESGLKYVIRYGDNGKITEADSSVSDHVELPSFKGNPQYVPSKRKMVEWLDSLFTDGRVE